MQLTHKKANSFASQVQLVPAKGCDAPPNYTRVHPLPYRGASLIRNCPPVAVGSNAPLNYTRVQPLPYRGTSRIRNSPFP